MAPLLASQVLLPGAVAIQSLLTVTVSGSEGDRDGFAKRYVLLQQEMDHVTDQHVSEQVVYLRLPVLRLSILREALLQLPQDQRAQLRANAMPWHDIFVQYAEILNAKTQSKRIPMKKFTAVLVQHMQRLEAYEHLSTRARRELHSQQSAAVSNIDHSHPLEDLRSTQWKMDRIAHHRTEGSNGVDAAHSDSDENGNHSDSSSAGSDTSLFSSDSSDGGDVSDEEVPDQLQLDMGQWSDTDNEDHDTAESSSSEEETSDAKTEDEAQPVGEVEMFEQWHTQQLKHAQEHYTDLFMPHVFAGVLHPEALLVNHGEVAVLQSHVSHYDLLRLLYFITEPDRLDYTMTKRVVKFLQNSSKTPVPLVLCTGSPEAQRYIEKNQLLGEDSRVRALVLGPHSAALRGVSPWMHLCHLGEALYLRWLLDGNAPDSPWHMVLLMFTAQRMATWAMLHRNGMMTPNASAAQWMTAHVVGQGLWDDLKAKYNEVSQSLQQKFPAWRQTISDQLQRYTQQATNAVQSAYGQTKQWSAELATKYEQQFKPWLKQQSQELSSKYELEFKPWVKKQYEERLKPAAISAWNSTREASRNLVKYASQARQYVVQHMSELMERLKNDPRYAQLKEKLRALAKEARESGVQFWDYMKQQFEAGKIKSSELLDQVRQKLKDLQVKLSRAPAPDLVKALEAPPPSVAQPSASSSDVLQNRVAPPSATTFNKYGAPENNEGELDLDYINNFRPLARIVNERPLPPVPTEPSAAPAPERRSFFEPMPASEQQQLFEQPSPAVLSVEPLAVPPPLPPRNVSKPVVIPSSPPPPPPREPDQEPPEAPELPSMDGMLKHMPTTWQSTPEGAAIDAQRLIGDLDQAMNQVQWWLSGNDTSHYNPVVVSSTLTLIEQVRDGIAPELGGGKQHSATNHNNHIYQLMMSGYVQEDDARQLMRNQEIQRMVGLANRIMIEATYGASAHRMRPTTDVAAYSEAAKRLIDRREVSTGELEDLMAFIEALEDQQLHLAALRGPFDRSVKAASEMRVSGRAYAHELYHDQTSRDTLCDPLAYHVHDIQAIYDPHSGLSRGAVFHTHPNVLINWCDAELLGDIENILERVDNGGRKATVSQALYAWRQERISNLSEKQEVRLMNMARAFNWLFAAGSMLQLTHDLEVDEDDTDASDELHHHLSMSSTWSVFVRPTVLHACAEHLHNGLHKGDPLQLHVLDQEFYASLRALTKVNSVQDEESMHYYNAAHAREELAWFLHRCRPLDLSQSPNQNQWHLLWEAVTAYHVQELGVPEHWCQAETPKKHKRDPVTYWRDNTPKYHESVHNIVHQLHRATELERRCALAHEYRLRESQENIEHNSEHHLLHMQHYMRAQRCWAIHTLRAFPEHLLQYVILSVESTLGPLCQECVVPWTGKATKNARKVHTLQEEEKKTTPLQGGIRTLTWERTQRVSAESAVDDDTESMASKTSVQPDVQYAQPVAFAPHYIHPHHPSPVSVGAVMLEVHAARSWREVGQIFTSYGLLEYV